MATHHCGAATAEPLGQVLGVSGSQAEVEFRLLGLEAADRCATVGKFARIHTRSSVIIGVVTRVALASERAAACATGQVDLLGEIRVDGNGKPFFQRGVTEYPMIGDAVDLVTRNDLVLIYDTAAEDTIDIGSLQQDGSLPAYVNVEAMITRHFAVLGTTGVGKSSGVALLLQEILNARPDLRIFLIDPHNEYGPCFRERAQVLNPRNLRLPFWLFNFEEIVDVFFRGRPGVEEEVEILSAAIPQAKSAFASLRSGGRPSLKRQDAKNGGFTADMPVPYRLEDLVALIDERMGKLENRSAWARYHRLMTRIETVRNDPRYAFMFDSANVGGDTMVDVLSNLFRLPHDGVPMTVMQLAGFPAEVVDSVVSVLCRMAFEFGLWSDGAAPLLVVCEEAHRYAPADRTLGFGPTRKALSRIAKEGRKYGVFLGLVTQRPAELDPTILSQCSTLFAMRMANERDQAIVRSAVSDAASSLIGFVPALGTREVFAFGEGVALPTRLRFRELPSDRVPRSEAAGHARVQAGCGADRDFIASVVERWRGAMMRGRPRREDDDLDLLAEEEFRALRAGIEPQSQSPAANLRPDSYFFPNPEGSVPRAVRWRK
jgi:DNA helicase HerA-like ATPase